MGGEYLHKPSAAGGWGSSRENDHLLGNNNSVYTLKIAGYRIHDD